VTKKSSIGGKQWTDTILAALVMVLVFAVIFPSLGNSSQAWAAVQEMSAGRVTALFVSSIGVTAMHSWPFQTVQRAT